MAFYLKYRPQTIDDLDLQSVREDLTKIVKSGNLPHAYLFAGPKGTGKTSAARILAKIVNCEKRTAKNIEPCNTCDQCKSITNSTNIDVIEMDAASNRGIDDIRVLKDAVKLAPALAKSKIYIIDEAHMLTNEASNALLKTLEEPPSHVVFILATTNPEKLISTVRSRTHLVRFNKATIEEVVKSLGKKALKEKIKTDDKVLHEIAKLSDGSFRDADKLLEQTSYGKKYISVNDINELNISDMFNVGLFFQLLSDRNTKKALDLVDKAINQGVSAQSIADKVVVSARKALLGKIGIVKNADEVELDKKELISLIKLVIQAKKDMAVSYQEQIPLEVFVVEWCEDGEESSDNENADSDSKFEENINLKKSAIKVDEGDKFNASHIDENNVMAKTDEVSGLSANGNSHTNGNTSNGHASAENRITNEIWTSILSEIRPLNASTEALLRASRPLNFDGRTLNLGVYYTFHKEHLESLSHKMLLEDACAKILGGEVRVVCSLTEAPVDSDNVKTSAQINTNGSATNGNRSGLSGSTLTDSDDQDIINIAKDIFGD